uniref:Defensin beta 127 n=1 Tax=Monodon monoceros TaxID=40151 RepID=A0A8C6AS45_MONMO
MRLLLIIAILLLQNFTVTKQLKKCWGEYIRGFYRKICKTTEIHEVLCENGRYCCLNIMELEALKFTRPPRPKPVTYAFTFPQEYYADEQNYTNSKKFT